MASTIIVGLLALGVTAACDEENEKKSNKGGGGGGNANETSVVEDYCDRAAEFINEAQQNPNPELVDTGTELFAEGQSIAESADDAERAAECTNEVSEALTELIQEMGPAAT